MLRSLTVYSHRPRLVAALTITAALLLATPAMAQQQESAQPQQAQQQPDYQPSQDYQPSDQGGNAPGGGGGNTPAQKPTAPGSGAGPGNAGAAPGATTRTLPTRSAQTLPLTGFEDGLFLAALGFVLLLAGTTVRRALRAPQLG